MDSPTRNITTISIKSHDGILLCDSPGTKDTHGAEVDLANSIAFTDAIKKCNNVRIVVITNKDSFGHRASLFKESIKALREIFMENLNNHIDSFAFLFNKFHN